MIDSHGNLDRDRLQWLAENKHYMADPWKWRHCVKAGTCAVCGAELDAYDSKWHHPDGRIVCSHHWMWNTNILPPSDQWMYYTDG